MASRPRTASRNRRIVWLVRGQVDCIDTNKKPPVSSRPPSKALTGAAQPGRMVCTSGPRASAFSVAQTGGFGKDRKELKPCA